MAGDWIKVESVTPDKPEVDMMANELDIDHDSVVGKLIRLWIWADQQSISGNGLSVTKKMIDRITFHNGFSVALEKVGWLKGVDGAFSLPNFEQHNGQTAKTRAATNRRVAKSRANSNAPTVTKSEQKPLPEKRRGREEKSTTTTKANFTPPTKDEFTAYMKTALPAINPEWSDEQITRACHLQFETYTEQDWHTGGNDPRKIGNWKNTAKNSMKHLKPWNFGQSQKNTPSHHSASYVDPTKPRMS